MSYIQTKATRLYDEIKPLLRDLNSTEKETLINVLIVSLEKCFEDGVTMCEQEV